MALTDPSQSSALSASLAQHLADRSAGGLAQDQRSLDGLKRAAQSNPRAAIKQAATQFQALFVQQVLKQMRDSSVKSGLFESHANDTYTSMLDQQLSVNIAAQSRGLTDVIARQLSRNLPADPNEAAAKSAKPASTVGALPAGWAGAAASNGSAATAVAKTAAANAYRATAEAAGCAWFSGDEALEAADADQLAPDGAGTAATTAAGAISTPPAATAAATPTSGGADATKAAFVARLGRHAKAAEQLTGIPARFIVGQAALETGWGQHEMRGANGKSSHNLFGIKAGSDWTGKTVDVPTTEYANGVAHRVVQRFRAYDSDAESVRDWAQLVAGNPRYAGVVRQGQTAAGFANSLQKAGYATDPSYRTKLLRTIDGVASASSNTLLASGAPLKSGRPTPT